MLIKRFISDEEGNVALEAIWSVLTLAVFLLPTVMLFEIMDTQLDNNIGVRSAARNEAINSNCNGNFFIPLPGGGNSTNTSTSVLGCLKSNKTNDYWKKMQSVANGHYNGLADSFQSEGETNLIRSNVALHMTTAQDPYPAHPETGCSLKCFHRPTEMASLEGNILAEGEALQENHIDTISVRDSPDTQGLGTRLIRDTAQNREWILGAKLNRPVPSGQILTYDMFEPLVGVRLDTMIAPGMRATTINVNSENSLNNKIVPGNRIDILGVRQGEGNSPDVGEVILEDVQVLAVGSATSLSEYQSDGSDYSTITMNIPSTGIPFRFKTSLSGVIMRSSPHPALVGVLPRPNRRSGRRAVFAQNCPLTSTRKSRWIPRYRSATSLSRLPKPTGSLVKTARKSSRILKAFPRSRHGFICSFPKTCSLFRVSKKPIVKPMTTKPRPSPVSVNWRPAR